MVVPHETMFKQLTFSYQASLFAVNINDLLKNIAHLLRIELVGFVLRGVHLLGHVVDGQPFSVSSMKHLEW